MCAGGQAVKLNKKWRGQFRETILYDTWSKGNTIKTTVLGGVESTSSFYLAHSLLKGSPGSSFFLVSDILRVSNYFWLSLLEYILVSSAS